MEGRLNQEASYDTASHGSERKGTITTLILYFHIPYFVSEFIDLAHPSLCQREPIL